MLSGKIQVNAGSHELSSNSINVERAVSVNGRAKSLLSKGDLLMKVAPWSLKILYASVYENFGDMDSIQRLYCFVRSLFSERVFFIEDELQISIYEQLKVYLRNSMIYACIRRAINEKIEDLIECLDSYDSDIVTDALVGLCVITHYKFIDKKCIYLRVIQKRSFELLMHPDSDISQYADDLLNYLYCDVLEGVVTDLGSNDYSVVNQALIHLSFLINCNIIKEECPYVQYIENELISNWNCDDVGIRHFAYVVLTKMAEKRINLNAVIIGNAIVKATAIVREDEREWILDILGLLKVLVEPFYRNKEAFEDIEMEYVVSIVSWIIRMISSRDINFKSSALNILVKIVEGGDIPLDPTQKDRVVLECIMILKNNITMFESYALRILSCSIFYKFYSDNLSKEKLRLPLIINSAVEQVKKGVDDINPNLLTLLGHLLDTNSVPKESPNVEVIRQFSLKLLQEKYNADVRAGALSVVTFLISGHYWTGIDMRSIMHIRMYFHNMVSSGDWKLQESVLNFLIGMEVEGKGSDVSTEDVNILFRQKNDYIRLLVLDYLTMVFIKKRSIVVIGEVIDNVLISLESNIKEERLRALNLCHLIIENASVPEKVVEVVVNRVRKILELWVVSEEIDQELAEQISTFFKTWVEKYQLDRIFPVLNTIVYIALNGLYCESETYPEHSYDILETLIQNQDLSSELVNTIVVRAVFEIIHNSEFSLKLILLLNNEDRITREHVKLILDVIMPRIDQIDLSGEVEFNLIFELLGKDLISEELCADIWKKCIKLFKEAKASNMATPLNIIGVFLRKNKLAVADIADFYDEIFFKIKKATSDKDGLLSIKKEIAALISLLVKSSVAKEQMLELKVCIQLMCKNGDSKFTDIAKVFLLPFLIDGGYISREEQKSLVPYSLKKLIKIELDWSNLPHLVLSLFKNGIYEPSQIRTIETIVVSVFKEAELNKDEIHFAAANILLNLWEKTNTNITKSYVNDVFIKGLKLVGKSRKKSDKIMELLKLLINKTKDFKIIAQAVQTKVQNPDDGINNTKLLYDLLSNKGAYIKHRKREGRR